MAVQPISGPAHFVMQAFIWDIQDSMYSDETGEGDNDNPGQASKTAVRRSSSTMSDQMARLSGNGERRASNMSAQVSLPDDAGSGSVRGSIAGSATGFVTVFLLPLPVVAFSLL